MDVQAYLAEQAARVDAYLEDRVPPADRPPARLHGAMRHLLFPGGKRFRPALAMTTAPAATNGRTETVDRPRSRAPAIRTDRGPRRSRPVRTPGRSHG